MSTPNSQAVLLFQDDPPSVQIKYDFVFSLFQMLYAVAGRGADAFGEVDVSPLEETCKSIRKVENPLGLFNFFETAILNAADSGDVEEALKAKSSEFIASVSGSIQVAEPVYRRTLWPTHQESLQQTMSALAASLSGVEVNPINELAKCLRATVIRASYDVQLVPVVRTGVSGYSHPTVVSTESYHDISTVIEIVIHEIGHVIAKDNEHTRGTVYDLLRRECESIQQARELFHILLFHTCGNIVRELVTSDHQPYAVTKGVYRRMAARGVTITEHLLTQSWNYMRDSNSELTNVIREIALSR